MKRDTTVVISGRHPFDQHGIVNPPVYHASTVLFPTVEALHRARENPDEGVIYGRRGTPTSGTLEEAVATLEGGHACATYPSGLAAITAALLAFVKVGDHVLIADAVYGPTRRFCDTMLARLGVETTYYDPLVGSDIAALMRDNTTVVFTESPGSLTFEVQDIPAIAAAVHERGACVMMDNTWASPLYFEPFAKGVDVSIQAATKYIVGHSDAMLGTVTTTTECWPALQETTQTLGLCAGPDDLYLAQRGLRTLSVRLERHHANALGLARWLIDRPEVARVMYPALDDDPGHTLWQRDFSGASGLFGVVLEPCSQAARTALIDASELFGLGYSWGGYESLMVPTDPASSRTATAWDAPGPSLRIHAGLEDLDDLIVDLDQGFARLRATD